MAHAFSYDCKVKDQVRVKAFAWTKSSPARIYLCLPARECLCVQTALREGVISKDTTIVFIEEERHDFDLIGKKLKELGFNKVWGIHSTLLAVDLGWQLVQVHVKYNNGGNPFIDLAFIDLCGEYTPGISQWLHNNRRCFETDAIISITCQANGRYYDREWSKQALKKRYKITSKPEYVGRNLIPFIHTLGSYPSDSTKEYTADCWAAMMHTDLFGKPKKKTWVSKPNNHYIQQILYRSPHKKQNMSVTTFRV